MTRVAGIILCGGKSSRMGRPKAWLPFGSEVMLQRVVRVLGELMDPLVVVAAAGQALPELPEDVHIIRDEREALGPLGGLAAGLAALEGVADAAYVSACDVPLLQPGFVKYLIAALEDHEIVIPREGTFHHPLAAVYRTSIAKEVQQLLDAGKLRPVFLLERVRTREISIEELRTVDPELASLRNTNTPEEYAAALREAGLAV